MSLNCNEMSEKVEGEGEIKKKVRKPRTKKADMIKKKLELEQKKLLEPPKKRGRKPKGGKLINKNINIHETIIQTKPIILHLKCKTSDITQNNITISNEFDYNPEVIKNIEPYDNDDNNYTFISNDKTDSNIKKEYMNNKEISNNSEEELNNKNINDKEKNNEKKRINSKIKDLERLLNTNNIVKKSACFWCTYDFNSNVIHIPSLFYKGKYDVYGCFCSPECACSYLFKESIDNNTKFERYQMLNYIYGKAYNYTKNIKPAPNPYYLLNKYYGNLSIQEYRQLLEYDRLILVIDKPLTKIYPEVHEDNNEFETIYENKITLKKSNKINKNTILNKVFQV